MRHRRWLPIYAPLMVLAALSFWLSPLEDLLPPPAYSAVLLEARYSRPQDEDTEAFKLDAQRIEYAAGEALLYDLQLSQSLDNGRLLLKGDHGTAMRGEEAQRRVLIYDVHGHIENGGRRLTLVAEEVVYNTDEGVLLGRRAHIKDAVGDLRGDQFWWNPEGGIKMEGNVKSVYQR